MRKRPAISLTGLSRCAAILFIVGYFLCEMALVGYFSYSAGLDDAEQLANSRSFAWGYGGSQPPLYTWLTLVVTRLLGTHLISLQLVKFSLLASLFVSLYATMRKLGVGVPIASAAMMGLFLVPQIGWESQRALTHSVLATAGCSWSLLAFVHYAQQATPARAVLLGTAMAVALLGKFNSIFFIVALFCAALSINSFREGIKRSHFVLVPLVTLSLVAPALLWIVTHNDSLTARIGKLAIGSGDRPVADRLLALWDLATKTVYFIAPVLLIAVVCAVLSRRKANPPDMDMAAPPVQSSETKVVLATRLFTRLIGFGLLAVAVFLVASGATHVKDRWLQPVLFVCPALLSLWLARYYQAALVFFTRCCFVVAIMIPIILGLYLQAVFPRNKPAMSQLDYGAIYAHVIARRPIEQILSTDSRIGGNMRLFQPDLDILHIETSDIDKKLHLPFVVLWTGTPTMPAPLEAILTRSNIQLRPDIHHLRVGVRTPKGAGIDLYYVYYPALY